MRGLLPRASNYTFLARVRGSGDDFLAVYKPTRGERPLWDFPVGTLASRERAAYLVSERAGFGLVPPTIVRDDLPLGPGSLQLFVDHDPERHYFVLMHERPEDFAPFALFDVIVNNADRKAGHVFEDPDGRLWGVDHGVTFHPQHKLRTVIWAFADEPLGPVAGCVERFESAYESGLGAELAELLSPEEAEASRRRAAELARTGRFPVPSAERPLPWPLI